MLLLNGETKMDIFAKIQNAHDKITRGESLTEPEARMLFDLIHEAPGYWNGSRAEKDILLQAKSNLAEHICKCNDIHRAEEEELRNQPQPPENTQLESARKVLIDSAGKNRLEMTDSQLAKLSEARRAFDQELNGEIGSQSESEGQAFFDGEEDD
jgi:hypothetical protein